LQTRAPGSAEAATGVDGDIVVLAVPYTEAPHVVREYAEQLSGTVIVDPTNPVDFGVSRRWRCCTWRSRGSLSTLFASAIKVITPVPLGGLVRVG
jgi:predicted dinucleotide-binding enzyme